MALGRDLCRLPEGYGLGDVVHQAAPGHHDLTCRNVVAVGVVQQYILLSERARLRLLLFIPISLV